MCVVEKDTRGYILVHKDTQEISKVLIQYHNYFKIDMIKKSNSQKSSFDKLIYLP
jgi:hypothetical protein